MSRKREKLLKGREPEELSDTDLDVQIGVLQRDFEAADADLTALDRARQRVSGQSAGLAAKLRKARDERTKRDRGKGNGPK